MLGVAVAVAIWRGGAAYLISSWIITASVGVAVGALVALIQLFNGGWAVSTGATMCHSRGTSFSTR